jgi:hypothetical protein
MRNVKLPRKKVVAMADALLNPQDPLPNILQKTKRYNSLKPEQIMFARFCAQPKKVRKSMEIFAHTIGVTRQTLHNWKRAPLVMELRNELIASSAS